MPKKPKFIFQELCLPGVNGEIVIYQFIFKCKVMKEKYLTEFQKQLIEKMDQVNEQKERILQLDFTSVAIANPMISSKSIEFIKEIEPRNFFKATCIIVSDFGEIFLKQLLKSNPPKTQTHAFNDVKQCAALIQQFILKGFESK